MLDAPGADVVEALDLQLKLVRANRVSVLCRRRYPVREGLTAVSSMD